LTIGAVIDQGSASAYASWPSAANLAIDHVNQGLAQAGAAARVKLVFNDTSQDASVATMRSLEVVGNQGARAVIVDTPRTPSQSPSSTTTPIRATISPCPSSA
jgi:hypothetical protein